MTWIKLPDDTFAEEASPDPRRVLTIEQLEEEKTRKEQEISMYDTEIAQLTERKAALGAEVLEITTLLNQNE